MASYFNLSKFLLAALASLLMPFAAVAEPRQVHELSAGWRFYQGEPAVQPLRSEYDHSDWQQVSVPHSWNRLGEYRIERSDATNAFQGAGWYRLRVGTPNSRPGDRHILQFDGVGTVADVWLNGHHVGQHHGGYSAFRFDVTDFVRPGGQNVLVVKADNSKPAPGSTTADTLPLSGDFFPYGGIYRSVSWIVAPPVQIDLHDQGGSGVYVSTISASKDRAEVRVVTRLRSFQSRARKVELVATVSDDQGVKAKITSEHLRILPGKASEIDQRLSIARPRLWNGRRDPYLHKVTVELRSGKKLLDRVEQPLGIRTFRIDPYKGFFLNGQQLALRGVSRHQDAYGKGAALSDADHERDMDLIEEVGANTIRFAHYQHANKWFDLADRRGMVVWAEIPYVSMATFGDGEPSPKFVENARQQLIELVRQNFNHPSVVVWGIGNEVDSKTLGGKQVKALTLLQELNRLAKQEDPSRLTALADCCSGSPLASSANAEKLVGVTDVAGFNRYPGWYSADPRTMGTVLDVLHTRFPEIPMSVTEYGAGGALSQHTDNPEGGPINAFGRPHPEGYQSWVHEENWRALNERSYLWSTWVWNMFDFASDFRKEGDAIDLNDKGLVTFDRQIRKDAFFFYQANWSETPVIHLNGSRYVDRPYPVADITAYSNAAEAKLVVNGIDAGSRPCADRICVWRNVALRPGQNRLVSIATFDGVAKEVSMDLNGPDPGREGVRINAGDLTSMHLEDGRHFGSDHFFTGGEALALNPRTITALFERRGAAPKVVIGARSAALHEGYREGHFKYDIPLPNGIWTVRVTSFESGVGAIGLRTFAVFANGKPAVTSFDPFAVAGGSLREATLSFPVTVRNGRLTLSFEPVAGPALVSAIEIERQ